MYEYLVEAGECYCAELSKKAFGDQIILLNSQSTTVLNVNQRRKIVCWTESKTVASVMLGAFIQQYNQKKTGQSHREYFLQV